MEKQDRLQAQVTQPRQEPGKGGRPTNRTHGDAGHRRTEGNEDGQVPETLYTQEKDTLRDCARGQRPTAEHLCTSPQDAIRAKMNKVEGSVSQLHQNHRQDYWCPSLFWEPELESLHHAIDMKNEQTHELEKQLLLPEIRKEKRSDISTENQPPAAGG